MHDFQVDTGSLRSDSAAVAAVSGPLSRAAAGLSDAMDACGAAGSADVAGGLEAFVDAWRPSVVALRLAAEGLSESGIAAAAAYENIDACVIPQG